jgi:hypothetical protein
MEASIVNKKFKEDILNALNDDINTSKALIFNR